jgi:hypothetical protein
MQRASRLEQEFGYRDSTSFLLTSTTVNGIRNRENIVLHRRKLCCSMFYNSLLEINCSEHIPSAFRPQSVFMDLYDSLNKQRPNDTELRKFFVNDRQDVL